MNYIRCTGEQLKESCNRVADSIGPHIPAGNMDAVYSPLDVFTGGSPTICTFEEKKVYADDSVYINPCQFAPQESLHRATGLNSKQFLVFSKNDTRILCPYSKFRQIIKQHGTLSTLQLNLNLLINQLDLKSYSIRECNQYLEKIISGINLPSMFISDRFPLLHHEL